MKHQFKNKKAFTLIELLIVIAIIGILFIVLISKVDFATDKAKATGVQTDFRSFQVAIESVALENAGLATFGWDTGDTNGNRIRDSYDKGDTNQNGVQDDGEVFVGSKSYGETWTNVYTLTNPADADDKSAIAALEAAINKNLDPKLHITIADDLTITMSNGAQDPWNTEYHGYYITNALNDGKDRGAIVIYSNGANQEFGSEHSIAGGVVTVNVPGNNVYGKDDYGMSVIYTYVNGYGEIKTTTSGFSVNQTTQGNVSNNSGTEGTEGTENPGVTELLEPGLYQAGAIALYEEQGLEAIDSMLITSWDDLLAAGIIHVTDGIVYSNFDNDTGTNESNASLDGDLVLPNDESITSIGDFAFRICSSLTGVLIPNSVTNVGSDAFYGCTNLTSVTIPDRVTNFGKYAFYECTALEEIYFNATAMNDLSSNNYIFYNAGKNGSGIKVVIGANVTKIPAELFFPYFYSSSYSPKIISVEFEEGSVCTSIGSYVFYYCTSLTSIEIPDTVTSIGGSAFYGCKGLKNVVINDVTAWCGISFGGYEANPLYYASHLYLGENEITELVIPEGVTSINSYAFSGSGLTSVTISDSVASISKGAFYNCTSLTSVTIPNSVTSIGGGTSWSKAGAFQDCTSLTSITIPESVTSIGDSAFYGCSSLKSIKIPDGVTSIGAYIFYQCEGLTSITIPNGVTSIGEYAFYYCEGLTSLTIPNSVTSIGKNAFSNCRKLTSINIPDGVTVIEDYTFSSCNKLKNITIPKGVTSIGQWAFSQCNNLKTVVIPDGVTSIGWQAFSNCNALTSITIPNSVTSIDGYAFDGCYVLKSITIPEGVTSIEKYTFRGCSALKSITIPEGVTSIGESAFSGCYGLTSITISDSVTSIGKGAFYDCDGLTSVTIPKGVTSIGESAFGYCYGLTSIMFDGTIAQWKQISKKSSWNYNAPATYVQCTDGQVNL